MDQPPKEPGRVVDMEKTVAGGQIKSALDYVERAQMDLDRASEELYSVTGFVPERTKLGKLREQVHAHWTRMMRKYEKGRFGLDEGGRRGMGGSPSPPQL